ncbi:hypothetical protein IB394_005029 [Escherichia coli]|nr:hypothetical protein [Escherichia coli]EFH6853537.1 hypothetical protein [Escherichia coli]EFI5594190.1 hypothetical protein [Escherichia coli]EFI6096079.1 hypothetical protein [Escherichia coli]EFI8984642.1 hypothetical protein [Escherichia coli]
MAEELSTEIKDDTGLTENGEVTEDVLSKGGGIIWLLWSRILPGFVTG